MQKLWAYALMCSVILTTSPLSAQVFDDDTFRRSRVVSKARAVAMSCVFPGLGQMTLGHEAKGLGLFVGELVSLIVAINANECYKTLEAQHSQTKDRYLALQEGGRFEDAEELWGELTDVEDDLDQYHRARQVIYLSAAIYAYGLIDVLFFSSPKAETQRGEAPSSGRFEFAPQRGDGTLGIALACRFF